jgi:hypothetical protein
MACPVLGDRSIVQRLKSLSMTDISARRRWSGRFLIGAAALALPLTGSISYAQSEPAPPAPPVPPVPAVAPVPPAPAAPEVTISEDGTRKIVRIERRIPASGEDKERRIEKRIIVHPGAKLSAERRAKLEKHMAQDKHGRRLTHRIVKKDGKFYKDGREMSAEERAEFEAEMKELRKELHEKLGKDGELHRELERELGEHSAFQKEMREKLGADSEFRREMLQVAAEARAEAHAAAKARAHAPMVTVRCREEQKEVAETVVARDGKQHIFVCNSLATAEAKRAIAVARAEIARTRTLSDSQRAEALRSLEDAENETRAD